MRSDIHKDLQNKAEIYLLNKGYWVCGQEVPMPVGVCDAWGMNRASYFGERNDGFDCMAIEVKVSRTDFRSRSQKYKEVSSFNLGNYQYVLCPDGLIMPEETHPEWGLLWWRNGRMVNKKKAPRMNMTAEEKLRVLVNFLSNPVNPKRPRLINPLQQMSTPMMGEKKGE